MENIVWLEEIERLEAERNDGKSLDGFPVLETRRMTLQEALEWEIDQHLPKGIDFIGPLRVDRIQKDGKDVMRYYNWLFFLDVDQKGNRVVNKLDVLKEQ